MGGTGSGKGSSSNALSPSSLASPVTSMLSNGNSLRSIKWLGTTFCSAVSMFSSRPGNFLSQSRSRLPTCLRCRFSWLPQSVQGMMGNWRTSAQRIRSFSGT
ncbi:hypothetical protein D9M69_616890 [compost metagenome]